MQQYADIYLLLNYSTCFGRPSRPSSGVHKTVVAASGTDHTIWEASFFKRDHVTFEEVTSAENLAPTGIPSPDRPARSESLYRLSYPGPQTHRHNIQLLKQLIGLHKQKGRGNKIKIKM